MSTEGCWKSVQRPVEVEEVSLYHVSIRSLTEIVAIAMPRSMATRNEIRPRNVGSRRKKSPITTLTRIVTQVSVMSSKSWLRKKT